MQTKTLHLDIRVLQVTTKAILGLACDMDDTLNAESERPDPWALTMSLASCLMFMADKGLYTHEELSEITRELQSNFSRVEGPKKRS